MNRTKIPWADYTWNPITGCSPVSEGCEHCYARALENRFNGGNHVVTFHPDRLNQPARVKKPARIFVCSMSDIFYDAIQSCWLDEIMDVIRKCPQHIFILLTKRPTSKHILGCRFYTPNLWLGVTAENQARADERIPILLSIPAAVRFVSVEPMLGPVDLTYAAFNGADSLSAMEGINWVIAGPETGPGARPCDHKWIENIYNQCRRAHVPFFDKRSPYLQRKWPT